MQKWDPHFDRNARRHRDPNLDRRISFEPFFFAHQMFFPPQRTVANKAQGRKLQGSKSRICDKLGLNSKSKLTFCNRSCYKFVDISQARQQRFTYNIGCVCGGDGGGVCVSVYWCVKGVCEEGRVCGVGKQLLKSSANFPGYLRIN